MKKWFISLLVVFGCFISDFYVHAAQNSGWQTVSNIWYYTDSNGSYYKGWHKISNKWYYFDSAGIMQTGWQKINGAWYYFDTSGVMKNGWQKIGGNWYYFYNNGVLLTNAYKDSYLIDSNGVARYFNLDYAYRESLDLLRLMLYANNSIYYIDYQDINSDSYPELICFRKNVSTGSYLVHSLFTLNGDGSELVGMDYASGGSGRYKMVIYQDGIVYSQNGSSTSPIFEGKLQKIVGLKGVDTLQSVSFDWRDYRVEDLIDFSLLKIKNVKPNHPTLLFSGWYCPKYSDYWYYFDNNGRTTGWRLIGKSWYYFDSAGAMQIGWQNIKNIRYYFNPSGAMQIGWHKLNNNWYYFDSSGAMQTGWHKLNNIWYNFDSKGVMKDGWQKINGKWYYFNSTGAMQTGWYKVYNEWYYSDASGELKTGWQKINGKWYYFNSSGVMQTGWKKIDGLWYYFDSSGVMQ